MTITTTTSKVTYTGNGSTDVFAYTFKIFADAEIKVYVDNVLKTLTTHYTISGAGSASGGNVTFTSGNIPADTTKVVLVRNIAKTQVTDYVENDSFPAETHESALDKLTMLVQDVHNTIDGDIFRFSESVDDAGVVSITKNATERANKLLAFNSAGGLEATQEIGVLKGNWAASTAYVVRDIIKDTSNNNIYICITAHTSSGSQPISSNTDVAKWTLIVDAASATTSASAAATSATAAATSATAAATSATAAASSATAAASSASTASTQASNASTSASNAATSASAAATSATAAATSATAAATSATASASSATAAAGSASTASTQASNASTSASTASTQASNASTSATNAASSASTASTQASNASTSATNAATSANNAEASAGALAFKYTYDNSTSMADPGTGEFRFNHGTLASVTAIAIDATSADTGNPDVSDLIASIDDGTNSAHEGYVFFRKSGAPATFMAYNVTAAITDNTGWLQITVTHAASSGSLTNGDTLYLSFSRSGNIGATGATGAQGPAGDVDTVLTTRGDVIYRNASTSARLAAGTSGYFLKTLGAGADPVWAEVTGGGPSLGTNSVIRTNAKTISENITFAGTENGSSVGPITVADTYTVTVASGSTWTII